MAENHREVLNSQIEQPKRGSNARGSHRRGAHTSRRNFLRHAGVLASVYVASHVLPNSISKEQQPVKENLPVIQDTKQESNLGKFKKALDQILSLELGSKERKEAERQVVDSVKGMAEINLALEAVSIPDLRIRLLDKSYEARANSGSQIFQLTPEQKDWAKNNHIFEETLVTSEEAREIAKKIITDLIADPKRGWAGFRQDLKQRIDEGSLPKDFFNTISVEDILISAGGMAALICSETGLNPYFQPPAKLPFVSNQEEKSVNIYNDTQPSRVYYGYANIGTTPSIGNSKPDQKAFPKAQTDQALAELVEELSKEVGLSFKVENIPGSMKDEDSITAGAIGMQMIPSHVKRMHDNLKENFKKYDLIVDPFNPLAATVMAYIYLAQGLTNQPGYLGGEHKSLKTQTDLARNYRRVALSTWNGVSKQLDFIETYDKNYRKDVLKQAA